MRTSLDFVVQHRIVTKESVKRSSLDIGDLFTQNDKTYMHTGCRSCPPTERSVDIQVGDHTITHELYPSLGRLPNGKDIIGYQSVLVKGSVASGEDGCSFTTNGERKVSRVGHATISLNM